uniref:Cytochrome b n=1 Tax=Liposcelis entomophila TaxID=550478 RepID=A0A096X706_9NEOP|nr:cytochrome b [Liposcelis entomophila]AHA47076.1 cytochrome b [Liposcelis entomophila]
MKKILFLPTPSSINYNWNFGSMLGLMLVSQILTGFFLSMFFYSSMSLAFESVVHIMNDVNHGWMIRFMHSTGASVFFILCYLHIGKAMFYNSFYLYKVWISGVLIFFILMATAFLGYVLPWGQMSLWGATVITNLISVIPFIGSLMVEWIWGGFNVSSPTLSRFYSFHFILPFTLLLIVFTHLLFLHETGSSNPLGLSLNLDKINFKNYFIIKDLLTIILLISFLLLLSLLSPFYFTDSENFIKANFMVTPLHIQPEWYFLFAYCVLRAIPNKLGGVIMLLLSILVIFTFSFFMNKKIKTFRFELSKIYLILFLWMIFFMLTWLGMKPVESPFTELSKYYTMVYFTIYLFMIINY